MISISSSFLVFFLRVATTTMATTINKISFFISNYYIFFLTDYLYYIWSLFLCVNRLSNVLSPLKLNFLNLPPTSNYYSENRNKINHFYNIIALARSILRWCGMSYAGAKSGKYLGLIFYHNL